MTIHIKALVDGVLTPGAATPFTFPGGEIHLKFTDFAEPVVWMADMRGAVSDDLIALGMLGDVAAEREDELAVLMPYLPAARADKGVPTGGYVYSTIINSFHIDDLIGLDPHSGDIVQWLDNLTVADFVPLLERAIEDEPRLEFDGVIAPDIGAKNRAERVAETLGIDLYQVRKQRDFETGKITSIDAPLMPVTGNYLVVDDICDGGATFRGVAAATGLDRQQLSLWVTHGIFSGEAGKLRESYKNILTTDSHPGHNRVGVATVMVPTQFHMLNTYLALKGE